jgi:fused signal recognition particle receptor
MVFDWFKRNLAPQTRPEPAPEKELEQEAPAAAVPEPAAEPVAVAPVEAAPAPAPVDQDALAWARQAYLRLKAEQEAQRAPAAPPEPPPSEPAPEPPAEAPPEVAAVEPPAPESPPAPQWTATVAVETPAPMPPPVAAPPPPEVPASPPEPTPEPPVAQPSPGPSLLELAAAQRRQRLEEITAPAAPEPVAPGTAPSPAPVREKEAEPELGAFDDTFTWSAEVLAAQGRRVEEVSIEEIDWLGRLRQGLEKTRRGFVTQLLERLGDDPLTPEVLDDLESTLLGADVGVQATDQVLDALRQRLNEEVVDPAEGIRFLKEQLRGLLEEPITASGRSLLAPERERLNVWLMVGVNGVGKTTTLGKLANLAVRSGYSALIAAADTFRAAAVQQVRVWGERSGVPVIANPSANADPAAVVFDAIGAARAQGTELVLVDTAGRLQTKHNLMEELAKVRRIVDKLAPEAAVESLLILDASQGQNGLRQAMAFAGAAGLTGVVITKLDGSARGGVAIAVAHEAGLPIRFIGAGEGIRDLRPFNSYEFVEALLAS